MAKSGAGVMEGVKTYLKAFYPQAVGVSEFRSLRRKRTLTYRFESEGRLSYILVLNLDPHGTIAKKYVDLLEPGDRLFIALENEVGVFESHLDASMIALLNEAEPLKKSRKFQLSSALLRDGSLVLKAKEGEIKIPVTRLRDLPEIPGAWRAALSRVQSSKRKPYYMPAALLLVLDWPLDGAEELNVPFSQFKDRFLNLLGEVDPTGHHDARMPFFHLSQGAKFWTLDKPGMSIFTDAGQVDKETVARLSKDLSSGLKEDGTRKIIRSEVYALCPADLVAAHRFRWSENRGEVNEFVKVCSRLFEVYPKESTSGKLTADSESWTLKEEIKQQAQVLSQLFVPNLHWVGEASVGLGNWANIPWFALFDSRVTKSAQNGVYPIGHFVFEDKKSWFRLGLGVAAKEFGSRAGDKAEEIFGQLDSWSRRQLESRGLRTQEKKLKSSGKRGRLYNDGMIAELLFDSSQLTGSINQISETWRLLLAAYLTWIEKGRKPAGKEDPVKPMIESDRQTLETLDAAVFKLKEAAQRRGLSYADDLLDAFLLSLKTKPFCLLVGPTGTGKSRLARLLEDIGAEVTVVPVEPSWTDGTPIIGYRDLNNDFRPGVLASVAKQAAENPSAVHVLVLDELNLARVEHYLAVWLSVLESRTFVEGRIQSDMLYQDEELEIPLPPNLVVVGTVNMDESTFAFSQRVLDRANALPLPSPTKLLSSDFTAFTKEEKQLTLSPNAILPQAMTWSDLTLKASAEHKAEIIRCVKDYLQPTQGVLIKHKSRARISFRLRDEICAYLLHGLESDIKNKSESFIDQQFKQRLLPKLCDGSEMLTRELVDELKAVWRRLPESVGSAQELLQRVQRLEQSCDMPISLWTALA